jgi:hypothetical protein
VVETVSLLCLDIQMWRRHNLRFQVSGHGSVAYQVVQVGIHVCFY